jgi:serine/threonine-protein kinase
VVVKALSPTPPPAQNSPQQKPVLLPGAVPIQMIRLLTDGDLAGKSHQELDLMRNEIYARHGRGFDRPELQRYFGRFDWYRPIYSPRDFDAHHQNRLNEVQRLNAELLLRYQQLGR